MIREKLYEWKFIQNLEGKCGLEVGMKKDVSELWHEVYQVHQWWGREWNWVRRKLWALEEGMGREGGEFAKADGDCGESVNPPQGIWTLS